MWILRLYVPGHSPRSHMAFSHLRTTCETHLKGKYRIVIIDLLKYPHLVFEDQIMSLPALVRKLPLAVKKIIGYLSETERVLIGLNQLPAQSD
ncbi:MAG TPA: circadian clock KaiB family protein [Bacteroidota bacterium]|nr:circadian clock KaiB family protein [Bacteroidota bacterium]